MTVPGRLPLTDGTCMDCLSVFILSPFHNDLFRGDPQHLIQPCLLCLVLAGARLTSVALQVGHAAQADGNVKRGTDTDTHTHTKGHVKHNNNILYTYIIYIYDICT